MEAFRGTPGPWVLDSVIDIIESKNGKIWIADCSPSQSMLDSSKAVKANLNLIAAAPDLLDALQGCLSFAQEFKNESSAYESAINAINKALGKEAKPCTP